MTSWHWYSNRAIEPAYKKTTADLSKGPPWKAYRRIGFGGLEETVSDQNEDRSIVDAGSVSALGLDGVL